MNIVKKILKALLIFGAVSNTLYVMSLTFLNEAKCEHFQKQYKDSEWVPQEAEPYMEGTRLRLTLLEALDNFETGIEYLKGLEPK